MNQLEILLYIFCPLFLAICVNLGIIYFIMGELKRNNPQLWEQLGKPSLLNSSIQNNLRMTKFLYSGRYRKINNTRVKMLGDVTIALMPVILLLFILFIVKTGGNGLHFKMR